MIVTTMNTVVSFVLPKIACPYMVMQSCTYCITKPPYRVLFFGTDNFSLSCLKILKENSQSATSCCIKRLEVVCLPNTGSKKMAVKEFAQKNGIPIHFLGTLPSIQNFDIGVVVSFGKLIEKYLIDAFPCKMINVHPSILPALRGAAPIPRAIEWGHDITGVSIMKIEANHFDKGKVLLKSEPVKITDLCTGKSLSKKLSAIGAEMLLSVLQDFPHKHNNAEKQDEKNVSKAPKITLKDCSCDFSSLSDVDILRKYRAFGYKKYYHLRCFYKEELIRLSELAPATNSQLKAMPRTAIPGQVFYHKFSKTLLIACKAGFIASQQLILNKKLIKAQDFKNGYMQRDLKIGKMVIFATSK